jgi:hypothetical protein
VLASKISHQRPDGVRVAVDVDVATHRTHASNVVVSRGPTPCRRARH